MTGGRKTGSFERKMYCVIQIWLQMKDGCKLGGRNCYVSM